MTEILGNDALLASLFQAISKSKLAGCYILEGAEGSGKLTIARHVASALMCNHPKKDGRPCCSCAACENVQNGNHVDVVELRPEQDSKHIPVSQVRELLSTTHMLPTQGDWRVLIIEQAECMKKEAQNALLKSIEEPRPNTVFFLLTKDRTKLLPTVQSRAVKLKTQPLPPQTIRQELGKISSDSEGIENAILLCGGSLGKAYEILGDPGFLEARKKVLSYFEALMNGFGFSRLCQIFPPSAMQRSDLSRLLPMIKLALRDLMCLRFGGTDLCFFTDRAFAKDFASILSPAAAADFFDLITELEQSITQNANLFSALSGFHLSAQRLTK